MGQLLLASKLPTEDIDSLFSADLFFKNFPTIEMLEKLYGKILRSKLTGKNLASSPDDDERKLHTQCLTQAFSSDFSLDCTQANIKHRTFG